MGHYRCRNVTLQYVKLETHFLKTYRMHKQTAPPRVLISAENSFMFYSILLHMVL